MSKQGRRGWGCQNRIGGGGGVNNRVGGDGGVKTG